MTNLVRTGLRPAAGRRRPGSPWWPQNRVSAPPHAPTAVGQALLRGTPDAYSAHDMDRARLNVWAPEAGLVDTWIALGTTVRGTCVLQTIES